jgi:colicin import membrane protein
MLGKLCFASSLLDFSHHLHLPSLPSFAMSIPHETTAEDINAELAKPEQELQEQLAEKLRDAQEHMAAIEKAKEEEKARKADEARVKAEAKEKAKIEAKAEAERQAKEAQEKAEA